MKSPLGLWDRRDVMVAGGVAAGAIVMSQDVASAGAAAPDKNCLIVADTRIAASREFAAESNGERVAWIEGDITNLWYEQLDAQWRNKKIAVAGLTEYGPFFCLERLAMDRRMRVAFKGSHRHEGSQLLHDIRGPKYVVREQAINALSDQHWPAHAARMAMASRTAGPTASQHYRHSSSASERWPLLVSWMIVPKRSGGERA